MAKANCRASQACSEKWLLDARQGSASGANSPTTGIGASRADRVRCRCIDRVLLGGDASSWSRSARRHLGMLRKLTTLVGALGGLTAKVLS